LKGKRLLIGAGVALDPLILSEELTALEREGARADLLVDGRCSLVSPLERQYDGSLERLRGPLAIGTTGRGIGPAYAMRALRLSPRAADLFSGFDARPLARYYSSVGLQTAKYRSWQNAAREVLGGMLGDVGAEVDGICDRGGSVLFEGSQGTLLDLLHGSYPYVTSTHTVATYLPASLGVSASRVGKVLGVAKCYTTRVGGGPFPSEIKRALGGRIRELGREYGATTGRPRRVGWLDLVALKYAVRINGVDEIALSKVDVLASLREFMVCVAYRLDGSETSDFQRSIGRLDEAEPVYESPAELHGASFKGKVPAQVMKLVDYLERALRVKVALVSFGEERSKTIGL
jgi:adenylosuccinate synthase